MSPFQIGLVLFAVVVGLTAATATIVVGCRAPRQARRARRARLPQGADAALWSIVEAVPDPRNHLALTRDLTGEVRVTGADRSLAAVFAASDQGPLAPERAVRSGTDADHLSLAGSSLFSGTPPLPRA